MIISCLCSNQREISQVGFLLVSQMYFFTGSTWENLRAWFFDGSGKCFGNFKRGACVN